MEVEKEDETFFPICALKSLDILAWDLKEYSKIGAKFWFLNKNYRNNEFSSVHCGG